MTDESAVLAARKDPEPPLDERAIEERAAERIAAWCHDYADASGYSGEDIAKAIRSGAWRSKP